MVLHNNIAIIEGDTHISKWVTETGRLDHDQWLLPRITSYIPVGGTVVDAGAYIGDHTIFYANTVGSEGSVFAFEPNHRAFECLAHNMASYPQVKIINGGLSDKAETAQLSEPNENYGMAHITGAGNIPCWPLDGFGLAACHFIKIDVEGFELKVLEGAKETIKKYKPVMLVEINSHTLKVAGAEPEIIIEYIKGLGYSCRNVNRDAGLLEPQFDLLCKPI